MNSTLTLTSRDQAVARCPAPSLSLVGGRVAFDARTAVRADVQIEDGRVRNLIVDAQQAERSRSAALANTALTVDLSGYLILPGLINAHDHLEFNLFPRLGHGPYSDFRSWARDIYHPDRPPLREHLAIAKRVRLWWGGMKNLICGVTTVCHHNPFEEEVFDGNFAVRVVRNYGWAHSLAFEGDVGRAFRSTPSDCPFVIHLAEGTDLVSRDEIYELDRLGALDARTVIVHGVGMNEAGRALLRQRGAALVWCPSSNLFALGTTLDAGAVRGIARIALGSDSALTAQGDLLDEFSVACHQLGSDSELVYGMVTTGAAEVLRLRDGEGTLRSGGVAELVVMRDNGQEPAGSLAAGGRNAIECVLVAGDPRLMSPTMARRWPSDILSGFEPLVIDGTERLVRAPVRWLLAEARAHLGADIRLAGRLVSA